MECRWGWVIKKRGWRTEPQGSPASREWEDDKHDKTFVLHRATGEAGGKPSVLAGKHMPV